MKTAVLVLAILGTVFGGLGAIGAFFFGAFIMEMSGGIAGRGAAGGALLALAAVAIGILGTALVGRAPRLAGVLCVGAAALGTIGTLAFALAAVLYGIGGVLSFFIPQSTAVPVRRALAPMVAALSRVRLSAARMPRASWRVAAIIAGAAVLVLALLGGTVLAQPAEQKPVRAVLEGLQRADDIALAAVLAPALRTGNSSKDAEATVSYALGASEIGFLNADWLRRLGPVTGTTMSFEPLSLVTTAKSNDAALVHVRGLFAPNNENAIMRLLLQGLRQSFDADIALAQIGGNWYVTRPAAPPPPPASSRPPVVDSRPVSTSPPPPTPAPVLRHLVPGTYSASASVNDINGWRLTLREITVNPDETVLYAFDLNVGTVDFAWAGRESRLDLRDGTFLNVVASRSTFYDGGKGPGTVLRVALAFPPGLAGNQPYVIRICGNFGYCWTPVAGPLVSER